jgi:hypothetical protein
MAEVRIDELNVTAVQPIPPEIRVDELNVTALSVPGAEVAIDYLYARGIAKLPGTIVVDVPHAGGIRRTVPSTRFKVGYKDEVLKSLGDGLGLTLLPANYDLTLGSVVSGNPLLVNLRLSARKASGYRRYSDVQYRRQDVSALLSVVDPTLLVASIADPLNTTAQIVARMNSQFGTKLTSIDFIEEPTPSGVDRILKVAPTSFYFQPGGQLNLGRLDLNERATEIVGLAWTEVDPRPYAVHAVDFTPDAAVLAAMAGTVLTAQQVINLQNIFLARLPAGTPVFNGNPYTHATIGNGLGSAPYQQLTLPASTTIPVDNSGFYNRALVLDLSLAPATPYRYLILHYNV